MNVAQSPAEDPSRARLLAYLPRTLVERWARDPRGAAIWHATIDGSLMHCDMSGFTAMSERLAGRGKEGAELMAGVLNRFFERMLGIADGWGGLQMKFGGDAMLLLFDGEGHAVRAAACAIDMQGAMSEFKDVEAGGERHRLRMRAGIHSGRFLAVSAGDSNGLLHYLLLGADVSHTTAVEAAAPLGATALSPSTAALVGDRARLAPHGDLWRLRSVDDVAPPPPRDAVSAAPDSVLSRYIMPPLVADDAHFAAEHRRVTAIFVNVLGMAELLDAQGAPEAARQSDAYLKLVIAGLERHGGFLAGSDAADHGDKLIILFGAPVSTGSDEAASLRLVFELRDALASSGLALRHRIGVSTGFVFAGEIGSSTRREYTVIGDSVNLAARLMAAAPDGAIYVSSPTAERAGGEFAVSSLKPMSVKGKAAPVRAFRLDGLLASPAATASAEAPRVLLARDDELQRLRAAADATVRDRRAAWMLLFGEAGIGKTAFLDEAAHRLGERGWQVLLVRGQLHRARDVFAAWQSPLRALLDVDGTKDDAGAWRAIDAGVARRAPDERAYAPLIAGLLGIPAEEGPLLQFLDARARRQRMAETLRAIIDGAAGEAPVFLIFDDAHLCDSASLELLAEVIDNLQAPLLLCLSSRASLPPDAFHDREPALHLELRELPADAARALASSTAALDTAQLDALLVRAGGNPLFVQELALTAAHQSDMPETVNDVIIARLDQLSGTEKRLLRAASVVGTEFAERYVQTLLGSRLDAASFERALEGLAHGGFISTSGEGAHAFRHPLTQEVVYDTLPFVERRSMHGHLAHEIERTSADHLDQVAALLLHHFDRADDAPKTVVYAARSGDRASRAYANREAIDYYTRGLTALGADGAQSDRSVLLERVGRCLETQGRHTAATEALVEALERWRERRTTRRRRLLSLDTSDAARESVLCRRVAVSYERSSSYDEALRWLEQALAALPLRGGRITAEIYAAKSVTLYRKGEYGDAVAWGRKALAAARRIGESDVIAYAENMIAQSYMAEGSLREAVRHLREAVRLYDASGDTPGQAAANNNLGSCYQLMGNLDDARKHYEIALAADERVGDLVDMAIIHNNIGEILQIQGATDEAIGHLQLVMEAHTQNEELAAVAGLSYVNLSRCALAQRRLDDAMRDIRRGLRLLRSVGAKGLATEARMQLSETLLAAGDVASAQREALRALKDAQSAGERLLEARGERLVGLTRAAAGAIDTAAIHLATSAGIARRMGAGREEARSLHALARLRIGAGGRPRTGGLRRAVMIFERMNAAPEVAESRALLARLEASADA